jgi:hypothetical protein
MLAFRVWGKALRQSYNQHLRKSPSPNPLAVKDGERERAFITARPNL